MKPPPFEYHMPRSVPEAVEFLSRLENAKVLAGGQSLMAMLNLRYLYLDHLIDINRIPELDYITLEEGTLVIGAMTRQRRIETASEVATASPVLCEALRHVGHRQTRNRGTLGGSLCHLDPAAELPAIALLHDATIRIVGPSGERTVPMADFMVGYMTPALEVEELVTAIEFPLWRMGHGYGFAEFARRHGDFAVAAAGCLIDMQPDSLIRRVAIVLAGVGTNPVRLHEAEGLLQGQRSDAELFARAAECCLAVDAMNDVHASADYRHSVASAMVRRSLATAYARARGQEVQP